MKVKKVRKSNIRSEDEIRTMLMDAESLKEEWKIHFHSGKMSTKENAEALRNYTALRGVVKALKWVLGSKENPLR